MTIRVSVNYNDPRWKRFNLARYITLLLSKVAQIHQIRLNNFSLSVLACGDVKIKELNKEYRKKNKATNVLAWPAMHNLFYLDQDYLSFGKNNYLFLGDIAISYERCLREASSQNVQFNKHCCRLLVHAILHLLGYDHIDEGDAKIMEALEIQKLNGLAIPNPYNA